MLTETEQGWIDESQAILDGTTMVLPTKFHIQALLTAYRQLQAELAQERTRLAGVRRQLGGYDDPDVIKGVYGWSLLYERARTLRQERDQLATRLATVERETWEGMMPYLTHRMTCPWRDEDTTTRSRKCTCGFDDVRRQIGGHEKTWHHLELIMVSVQYEGMEVIPRNQQPPIYQQILDI